MRLLIEQHRCDDTSVFGTAGRCTRCHDRPRIGSISPSATRIVEHHGVQAEAFGLARQRRKPSSPAMPRPRRANEAGSGTVDVTLITLALRDLCLTAPDWPLRVRVPGETSLPAVVPAMKVKLNVPPIEVPVWVGKSISTVRVE